MEDLHQLIKIHQLYFQINFVHYRNIRLNFFRSKVDMYLNKFNNQKTRHGVIFISDSTLIISQQISSQQMS